MVEQREQLQALCTELENDFKRNATQMQDIRSTMAFFRLRYLLQPKNEMIQQYKLIETRRQDILKQKLLEEDRIATLDKLIAKVNKIKEQLQEEILSLAHQISDCQKIIEPIRERYQGLLPDDRFLSDLVGENSEEERKVAQYKAPWNGDKLNELREKLFLEAMNLHKALVENSPQMRVQLDTFNKMIRRILKKEEMQKFSGILFQSFMLVVPVLSTTFASIGSFLKNIGREEFGLLLIDEAGQALPQSAPGAIWRAKKVIAVGDPLQIDPVVTIHDTTIEFLKQYFKQTGFIASKETSVQSLADEANEYVGTRCIGDRDFYIGSPLLVHGRCQRKIFDIANKIAYNGKMIYGTKDIEEPICDWIHVHGQATNKHFVRAQAEKILPIIKEAFFSEWRANGVNSCPSLFIISPFRSVKSGIIRYLRDKDYLYRELCKVEDKVSKKVINKWIYANIGTVHTFQGKEATAVIFCLGVDSGSKGHGAIQWASAKPNILNVAVTRAKENLYIVGDVSKWANQDYFMDAYKICEGN